jgi:hypothetical protein
MELGIDDCSGRPVWAGQLGSGNHPTKKVFAAVEVKDRVAVAILCKERYFE